MDNTGYWIGTPPWLRERGNATGNDNFGGDQITGQTLKHQTTNGAPSLLGTSAAKKGLASIEYNHGSATEYFTTVEMEQETIRLCDVWYLISSNGTLPLPTGLTATRLSGPIITAAAGARTGQVVGDGYDRGVAYYQYDRHQLFINLRSFGGGSATTLTAWFFYMLYNDDTTIAREINIGLT